jgi:transposase InsO family protein
MRRDVDKYVGECDECHRRKQAHEYRAPLGEVREPTYPFEITSMDIVGPLPQSHQKNKYMLTFICHFTKYAEAVPIPDMTAETCARAYTTHIVARHGSGSILVTDQGRSFTSVFFKEACRILGVRQLHSTPLHPQSNGVIERFHRTLNQALSHYVNATGINWDVVLPFCLMAYRATPHGTTGFSPYYLMHGWEMVLQTTQSITAKLSLEVRGTSYEGPLENLK